ncbi:hypothetical protein WA158_007373 [Blastocystis sp. Blastoise]
MSSKEKATFQAFDYCQIIKSSPIKITAIASYNNNIYISGKDGTIIQYIRTNSNDDQYNPRYTELVQRAQFSDTKSASSQLLCIPEWNMLFSINDYGVAKHNLSDLKFLDYLPLSKGASSMIVDDKMSMIAISNKKKVLIYNYDTQTRSFSSPKEISINDTVLTISFLHENLFVGTKKQYFSVDTKIYRISKDILTVPRAQQPICLSLLNPSLAPSEDPSFDDNSIPENDMSSEEGEIVLNYDNKGIVYDFLGRPARSTGKHIAWSSTPLSCVYINPYILTLEGKRIEVHHKMELDFVQTIPISGAKFMCASLLPNSESSIVTVATSSSVYDIQMRSIFNQYQQLTNPPNYRFNDALALCSLYQTPEYVYMKQCVNQLQGFYLFSLKKFDEAIRCFIKTYTPVDIVASLIHYLQPLDVSPSPYPQPQLSFEEENQALESMAEFLISRKKELISNKNEEVQRRLLKNKDNQEKIDDLLLKCYLRIDKKMVLGLLQSDNQCTLEVCLPLLEENKMEQEMIELYRVRGKNKEAIIQLLQGSQDNTNPISQKQSLIRLEQYLEHLGNEDINLIFQCTNILYRCDEQMVVDLFVNSHPDERYTPIDPNKILLHLKSLNDTPQNDDSPVYVKNSLPIKYLWGKIKNNEISANYHNELIFLYIESIISVKDDPNMIQQHGEEAQRILQETGHPIRAGMEPGLLGQLRKDLLEFLETSNCYQPEIILNSGLLPENDLLDERCIMLSRLHRHDEALNIILLKMKDVELAEEYCVHVIDRKDSHANSIFITFVKICLSPSVSFPDGTDPQRVAVNILTKYSQYINPMELQAYLKYIFTSQTRQANVYTMTKNLMSLEHDQILETYQSSLSRSYEINSTTRCAVCKKSIGTSIFCIYPNNTIVHAACNKNQPHICPITYENFDTNERRHVLFNKQ